MFPFRYLGEKFASSFLGLQFGVEIGQIGYIFMHDTSVSSDSLSMDILIFVFVSVSEIVF